MWEDVFRATVEEKPASRQLTSQMVYLLGFGMSPFACVPSVGFHLSENGLWTQDILGAMLPWTPPVASGQYVLEGWVLPGSGPAQGLTPLSNLLPCREPYQALVCL